MTTAGKMVLGMMGRLRPKAATGASASTIALPQVARVGGMPLMEALARPAVVARVRARRAPAATACRGADVRRVTGYSKRRVPPTPEQR